MVCSFVSAITVLSFFYIFSITFAFGVENASALYDTDSTPFNLSRPEWLTKFWNWTASISESVHPRNDETGERCGVAQNGPVWFLDAPVGEGSISRTVTCKIPSDKAVFIPLLTGECDYSEEKTDEDVTKCAKEGNDGGIIELSVDGKRLISINGTTQNDYSTSRVLSDFFNIRYNSSNLWDLPADTFRGRADGYFEILKPFPLGEHTIHLKTRVISPHSVDYNYVLDMTYKLIVS
jgi:hypothetical protein